MALGTRWYVKKTSNLRRKWISVILICFLDIQGCVDHYENCPQWARSGVCTEEPQFMTFLCRESCGTCGFKSRRFFG